MIPVGEHLSMKKTSNLLLGITSFALNLTVTYLVTQWLSVGYSWLLVAFSRFMPLQSYCEEGRCMYSLYVKLNMSLTIGGILAATLDMHHFLTV